MLKTNTKLSSVEIAKKQRHMFLLGKVKENKALSRTELNELKKYEREAKLTTAGPGRLVKPVVSRPGRKKRPEGKVVRRSSRKTRLPVDEAEVRRLGLECENLAEADAEIRTRRSLSEIFKKHPELRQAWDRGRFLRNIRDLARTGASVSQGADQLKISEQVFQRLLDNDKEIADTWGQEQLKLYVQTKRQVFDLAADGVPWAVKFVDNLLRENANARLKTEISVKTNQLAELLGKTSRTVYNWYTKFGLPRNEDKTFDLKTFLFWYEGFLIKKASGGDISISPLDPLKAIKAERIKVELAKHRKELVNRNEIIVGQIAWFHHIIGCFERGIEELTRLCYGQPREKIKEIFKNFFLRLHIESCKIPKEFRLSMKQERELFEFLQSLKSPDDSDKIT